MHNADKLRRGDTVFMKYKVWPRMTRPSDRPRTPFSALVSPLRPVIANILAVLLDTSQHRAKSHQIGRRTVCSYSMDGGGVPR